jgi:hypothetical protein
MENKRFFMNTNRIVWIGVVLVGISIFSMVGARDRYPFMVGLAHAQEDWKKEFDDICSKTQDAMVIPSEELKSLVDRCDSLKPKIEKLDESQRKVYLKRLQMCRELYFFVLESREIKK